MGRGGERRGRPGWLRTAGHRRVGHGPLAGPSGQDHRARGAVRAGGGAERADLRPRALRLGDLDRPAAGEPYRAAGWHAAAERCELGGSCSARDCGRGPAAPGKGSTSYLSAQYASHLKRWHGEVGAGRRVEAAKTRDTVSAWLRGLGLRARTGGLADPPGPVGSLAEESADAASALAGLEEEDGNVFGSRRVLVLYTANLAGRLSAGELAGDTVLVVTPFLPTAATASAAQADLLTAGAAQAAVVGPEVTGSQLAALVSASLSEGAGHDFVLGPGTVRQRQRRLEPQGRRPAHCAPAQPAATGSDRGH